MLDSPISNKFDQIMPLGPKVGSSLGAMLSFTSINSHSQVSDPRPEGHLVI